jgi:hypothetical protein
MYLVETLTDSFIARTGKGYPIVDESQAMRCAQRFAKAQGCVATLRTQFGSDIVRYASDGHVVYNAEKGWL